MKTKGFQEFFLAAESPKDTSPSPRGGGLPRGVSFFASIHSNFAWDLLKKYYIGDLNSKIIIPAQGASSHSSGGGIKALAPAVNNKAGKPADSFGGEDEEDD